MCSIQFKKSVYKDYEIVRRYPIRAEETSHLENEVEYRKRKL